MILEGQMTMMTVEIWRIAMTVKLGTFYVVVIVRDGFKKKKRQIIHIFKINNIHIKEFFYPHAATPVPSLIHIR